MTSSAKARATVRNSSCSSLNANPSPVIADIVGPGGPERIACIHAKSSELRRGGGAAQGSTSLESGSFPPSVIDQTQCHLPMEGAQAPAVPGSPDASGPGAVQPPDVFTHQRHVVKTNVPHGGRSLAGVAVVSGPDAVSRHTASNDRSMKPSRVVPAGT